MVLKSDQEPSIHLLCTQVHMECAAEVVPEAATHEAMARTRSVDILRKRCLGQFRCSPARADRLSSAEIQLRAFETQQQNFTLLELEFTCPPIDNRKEIQILLMPSKLKCFTRERVVGCASSSQHFFHSSVGAVSELAVQFPEPGVNVLTLSSCELWGHCRRNSHTENFSCSSSWSRNFLVRISRRYQPRPRHWLPHTILCMCS